MRVSTLAAAPRPSQPAPTLAEPSASGQSASAVAADGFSATAAQSLPVHELRQGMHGEQVKLLQRALVKLGLMTPAQMATGPGVFGPHTEHALLAFQKQQGLAPTGIFGPATRTAMAQALAAHAPAAHHHHHHHLPNADHGTPLYRQGDPRWGRHTLGHHFTIASAGCAMTATAMAISKISGKRINPGQLDHYLDTHHGYAGDGLIWNTAARARGLRAAKTRFSLHRIDTNLKAGKPVVIGVDYHPGSAGGPNGTDHWICVTAKKTDARGRIEYVAHDPATGGKVLLHPDSHGRLIAPPGNRHYKSTGQLVVFHTSPHH